MLADLTLANRRLLGAVVLLLASGCSKGSSPSASATPTLQYVARDVGIGRCTAADDQGDVIGMDDTGAPFRLDASGQRTTLGALPGVAGMLATGIDPSGASVVGVGITQGASQGALVARGSSWGVLPGLEGRSVSPVAVASSGAIAGSLQVGTALNGEVPLLHAFLLSGSGSLQDLGTVGGASSAAYAMSANGNVVGVSQTNAEDTHAFLYAAGVMTDLGTLGGPNSAAYGVSSAGSVVGVSETANGEGHAFLYSGGKLQDLDLGQARSEAVGISEAGVIVGNWKGAASDAGTPGGVPFVRVNGTVNPLTVADASGRPWLSSRVEGISPAGIIVGWGRPASSDGGLQPTHCVVWRAP